MRTIRLVLMTTSTDTLNSFFRWQSEYLSSKGFEIHWISSGDDIFGESASTPSSIHIHRLSLHRRVTPTTDCLTTLKLVRLLRQLRPTLVHTHTPKAGLIGMVAARLAKIPVRVCTINGRPSDTARGAMRWALLVSEFISCALASHVMCVSRSLKSLLIGSQSFLPSAKFHVVHCGSSHGVDTEKFNVEFVNSETRLNTRHKHGISRDAIVIGFVGRLVVDKGLIELAEAWKALRVRHSSIVLLICGPEDQQRSRTPECVRELQGYPDVLIVQEQPERMAAIYACLDIFVLPSYREGLPNVLLEAGAMSLPVVATRIPGCVDVVCDGETGLLVNVRDSHGLAEALETLIVRPDLRLALGRSAKKRIDACFSQRQFVDNLVSWYEALVAARESS